MSTHAPFETLFHPVGCRDHSRPRRRAVGPPPGSGRQRPHRAGSHGDQRPRGPVGQAPQPAAGRGGRLHLRGGGQGHGQGGGRRHRPPGPRAQDVEGHPARARGQERGRRGDCRTGSLARPGGNHGLRRREGRLRRETVRAQSQGRRVARGRRASPRPHRPDGQPAAIVAERHGARPTAPRGRPDWACLLRSRMVCEHARPDRCGTAGPGSAGPRLRVVAGPGAPTRSTATISSTTTGTGSGIGARARPATTARTRSM